MDRLHKDNVAVDLTVPGATTINSTEDSGNTVDEKYQGTSADRHDMHVMGNDRCYVYVALVLSQRLAC